MRFDAGVPAITPEEEWAARSTPFLLAADPHQACHRRAVAANSLTVDDYCDCPPPERCTKECCQ